MKHWTNLSKNPISDAAQEYVTAQLNTAYAGPITNLLDFWQRIITGKKLLDIGVVEHSAEFIERENWRHAIFSKAASESLGVDILADELEILTQKGYNVKLCDATSDKDLGDRFEVIYIGDVIEHVDDPVKLLKFAGRHLSEGGKVYVSTPCPFWWRNILLSAKDNSFIGNVDHVCWIIPVNALELAHRAGLKLHAYNTVETGGKNIINKMLIKCVNAIFGRNEFFTWNYIYTFSPLDNDNA